ncbi:MAG: selenocysteine-specific translation elongation factor [Eubacteriales bacterium]
MKNIIIGTAGHIDHGKTTLIKALTGRNTDRWEEEQRRGITIDLGFTYFDLHSGDRVGIIDVPGHEKFINNMVAGVVGMDLVMLVIAADEGIMPQTREHMDILTQLGMKKSIIVLNKCDLVEEDWLELVEEEIREELAGTFLEHAPVVPISAVTKQGLEVLVDTIERLTSEEVEEKDTRTIPRLPIDRAFSLSGFGTIITGTLVTGTITKDTVLQMYPNEKECKIRSIQVHGENVDKCYAGQRVAINLSNVKKSEIKRGCVLAPINSMKNTMMLDVKLEVTKSTLRVLTNHSRLHLFTGTSEILCRAVLLDKQEIGPGESGYVQLRLEEEIAIRRGDRFVVRFYSPMETIGGGVVLEANPTKKKRFKPEVIEELKCKEAGSSEDVIEMHIKSNSKSMISLTELAKLTALSMEEVIADVDSLQNQGLIRLFKAKKDCFVWHVADELAMTELIQEELSKYHSAYPYRYGMKKAEIHVKYMKTVKPNIFDMYIDLMVAEEKLIRHNEYLHNVDFQLNKDERFIKIESLIRKELSVAKYDFKKIAEISFGNEATNIIDDILSVMQDEGTIIKIMEDVYTLQELMEVATEIIKEKLQANNLITIAEVRDLLNTSRKSAKPILEYLDSIKVTKKVGAESERVPYL